MSLDDIIYVVCLLLCVGVGGYIRNVTDEKRRKLLSTGLGVLMVVIVSGANSLHCFVSSFLGFIAIRTNPRTCHLLTFAVMFGYLTLFRLVHLFGLPSPPGHTNMIQMILTLKVAGIAFERTAAWKKIQLQKANSIHTKETDVNVAVTNYDINLQKIGFGELFHYTFTYIGVLTGPYYRYRTYSDYFEKPFKNHAPNIQATIEKLKQAGFYCVMYLGASYLWPLDYALSDEFYDTRSFIYRLMYVWPTFFIFRMRMYTGLTLSECVCTMAGFGAYPDEVDATNGEGPRKPYVEWKASTENTTYNFTTIVNTRVKDVEKCITFREGMKHWNICVQYWLAVNIYKLFPYKKYRTTVTLLCSAYWHGFRPGHYFCIMGAPFYVALEDIWNSLIRKNTVETNRKIIDCIFWVAKFFAFSYLGMAFQLTSFANIWKYYSSVYHIGYISWVIFLTVGLFLQKQKKLKSRKHREQEEQVKNSTKVD